ncbi:FMN-binding glutamate synthase family protein [Patescibacteria group bacterium]|nr:FMN-binding glutamate synthase family protein [Patescibacteria group bacterium]MBU2218908.1 FMN-binding glutamate synthase family protein [Patescibacteria group bacterium]MBU2263380.1 FMN-binding glutamate synthase family protein [Patescibacteria group bacterium]
MNQDWLNEIRERTKKIPLVSGRSNKLNRISFDDLVFVPSQLAKKPVDYFKEKINSKTIVGKKSKRPVEISIPIVIGAMSFGALSREAKTALAKASAIADTFENTGEGGMLAEERKYSKHLIVQYSTGRFGINDEILKQADAVEIKIGQGAKGGQGGLLPKEKITDEIAKVRAVEKDKDIYSPASHLDIKNIDDLRKKIGWIREITEGAPIILKLATGHIEDDLELAVKAEPDIIALDGMEGGTGAAPEVMLNEMGIPSLAALARAREFLDKKGAKQELWIAGGFSKGGDFAKALALGADAVFLGFPLLVAMGCTYCRLCYLGNCPYGITTQNPELRKKLNIEEAGQNIANYIKNCVEEIKMIAGACGEDDIHKLNKTHLRALTSEMAEIVKVKRAWE